jgi:hypothetical protein
MKVSPTEAVWLLLEAFSPPKAAQELTKALHANDCRVWCDGVVVPIGFVGNVRVEPHLDSAGRWTATIASVGMMLGFNPDAYAWEFEADEVVTLLPRRRGELGGNWKIPVKIALYRLGIKAVRDLQNSGQLLPHLEAAVEREGGKLPKDRKPVTAMISAFLRGRN